LQVFDDFSGEKDQKRSVNFVLPYLARFGDSMMSDANNSSKACLLSGSS
jgi:hypothetical protein